ncbi:MAG: trypsin-like peptidase domain-containing protein [Planctomycetes bacterium]|nr:trypsin-like peptidase domain-containing protein [Planctomycetota bacterium]
MMRTILLLAFALSSTSVSVAAQAPIDDAKLEQTITDRCQPLLAAGKLVACATLVAAAKTEPCTELPVVAQRTAALEVPDLRDLVARSARIVGHFYKCTECEEWHFSSASGCCLSAQGLVATCAHVLAADEGMREAYLVSADYDGNVFPVEAVLAADTKADICILATGERGGVPLPLRAGVRAGESVFCLSNPDHFFGCFTEGRVLRRYLERPVGADGLPAADLAMPPLPWLHVSCAFARGSSGGAIVDARGNLVGLAQSTTTIVHDEEAEVVDTQMVLRTAAPVEALQALLRAAKPVPTDGGK